MSYILYIFFRAFILLFGIIPFPLLYGISDFIAFLLGSVFGYRKKVMKANLIACFPNMSEKERNKIIRKSYRNISDMIVEALKGFTMSTKQVIARHKVVNPELPLNIYNQGKSVIAVLGHYSNWEWGGLSAGPQIKMKPVAFYKPLSNKYIDAYMKKNRSRTGTAMVSIYVTANSFETYKNVPACYILVADQSPSNVNKAYWVNFMGIETACLHGPEKYVRKFNLPMVFLDIRRIKRGFYEIEVIPLTDKTDHLPDGEITRIYMNKMEEVIRRDPECWLWSHRRWKHKRQPKSQNT